MTLTFNGTPIEMPQPRTLEKLLNERGITPEMRGVAVAVNDAVVMKSNWAQILLSDGDKIEVIRATQGG